MDTLDTYNQYLDANIEGGEMLGGFGFDSLLEPTDGPILLLTQGDTFGGITYNIAELPLSYGQTDNIPPDISAAPEPTTAWLIGIGLLGLLSTARKGDERRGRSSNQKKGM